MIALTHEGLLMFGAIWFGIGFGLGGLWMLVKFRNALEERRAKRNAKHKGE